jgi:hypothetical protein
VSHGALTSIHQQHTYTHAYTCMQTNQQPANSLTVLAQHYLHHNMKTSSILRHLHYITHMPCALCIPPPVPFASGKSSGKSRMQLNKRPQNDHMEFPGRKKEEWALLPAGRRLRRGCHITNPRKPGGVPCRDDSTPIAIYIYPTIVLSLISFRRFSL